nr:hypothetical protein [uncultured Pseudomonas sp.]
MTTQITLSIADYLKYAKARIDGPLSVTGYSLGGHLATRAAA